MNALVEVRDLDVSFRDGAPPAVTGVSLAIENGAAVGIVGESGSGKTTLGRVLAGALEPTSGEVTVESASWKTTRRRDSARRRVQMIFQDPFGSLTPSLTPRSTVAEVLRNWNRISRREAYRRAEELLGEVGLPEDAMNRLPAQLSGGQCQRVGIARALACEPDLLIADEPTSALDVSVQAQILNLLDQLRRERGLALVLISHDLGVILRATDEALVMYDGHMVERGPTAELLERPRHPYTRVLVDSMPGRAGGGERLVRNQEVDGGCIFAARCHHQEADCLVAQPAPRIDGRHQTACLHPLRDDRAAEVRDLGAKP